MASFERSRARAARAARNLKCSSVWWIVFSMHGLTKRPTCNCVYAHHVIMLPISVHVLTQISPFRVLPNCCFLQSGPRLCVCVSHPDSKGFHSLTIHCNCDTYHFLHSFSCSRGPAHDITTLANEASDVMGCGQRRLTVYLPRNCCSRCPIRSVCFHGLSCFLPQTRGFSCSSALQPTRSAPLVLCRLEKHFMLKHLQILGLFAMLFYRLPSQRAN